jgi:adenylate cyclase
MIVTVSQLPAEVSIDDLVLRGLYDPEAPDADRRLELITFALNLGATIDDIERSADSLRSLVMRMRLGGGPGRYTLAEAAAKAGMPLDIAIRISLAAGFADPGPDVRHLDDNDVELLQMTHAAKEFFGEEILTQLTRVIGASTARMADAFVSAFATNVGTQVAEGRVFERDDFDQANESIIALIPMSVRVIELMLKRHLTLRSRDDIPRTAAEWEGVDTIDRAVGFCDVVGYTALSGQISTVDLARVLSQFEGAATDLITKLNGNVVKLIGDEVMFVAPNAATACDIALALVETFNAHPDVPAVRIGIASGRVITREGDYFGPTVNLAARIVKLAPEGAVVAPATFREMPGYSYEDAGAPELKGFEKPVPLVLVQR